jgi:ribosomal protein S11
MQKHGEKGLLNLTNLLKKKNDLHFFLYKNINPSLNIRYDFSSFFNRFCSVQKREFLFLYIQSKKRSTRISLINKKGLVLLTFSAGLMGYKKSNRKGSFSAVKLFNFFLRELKKLQVFKDQKIIVCLKGHGPGRRPILNLLGKGLLKNKCVFLVDLTQLPFNGSRLKKNRRL